MNEEQIKRKVNSLKDCFIAHFIDRKVVLKDINDIVFWTNFLSKDYYGKFQYSSENEKFREKIEKLLSEQEKQTINHEFNVLLGAARSGVIPIEELETIFFSKEYHERTSPV